MLQEAYHIHLPQFEGPFDLLLFFIERDELDIYDIPIAKITNDFLDYLHHLERRQIEVASEFMYMAAHLMKIKAVTLLPRPQTNDKGETIDPRNELIDRLLEYKKYKAAMEELALMEEEAAERLKRGFARLEAKYQKQQNEQPEDELFGLTLFHLSQAYKKAMERHEKEQSRPMHVIKQYPYTVENVKADLIDQIKITKRLDFVQIAARKPERLFIIFCFLCILELIQQRLIKVIVGNGYNNFWLVEHDGQPTAAPLPLAETN